MDLVQAYSSDSDIDSDSDSSLKEEAEQDKLPLLPPSLLDKYHIEPSVKKRKVDTMINRIWTSFIYLDWRLTARDRNTLSQYLALCNTKFKSYEVDFKPLFYSNFGTPLNLHLTLSPNLRFATETARDKFFSRLQDRLLDRPGWLDRTVQLQSQPTLLRTSGRQTTFLTLPVSFKLFQDYIHPIFSDINATLAQESLSLTEKISESFITHAHVSIAKTWATTLPADLVLPPLPTTLAIPADHSLQYDRNRESLTLALPNREMV